MSSTTLFGLDPSLALRQLLYFLVGFGAFFGIKRYSFAKILSHANLFYYATITLLVVVLLFSSEVRNTNRWISLGFFNLQPSQFAIPSLVLMLSGITKKKTSLRILTSMAIITLVPAVLIFLQPNLSMTLLILCTAGAAFWLQPIPLKAYLFGGVVCILLTAVSWAFLLQPYQKSRVESFLQPSQEMSAATYNVEQSKIAVGSGRLFGRGMQHGTQSQLQFLPEKETDFIFASFSEEFGLIGSITLLGLYLSLLIYVLNLLQKTATTTSKTFLVSVFVLLLAQVSINIGMNLGLLPVTGVALPLLSYGGSSLLSTCLIFGVIQSIAIETGNRSHLQIE
ncbi:MAG: rod shape-determining protein RodA [Candidatus Pacebacteria bacterium]|nr:rod shape-determining protein RodA [Candidatus Paceibacterota bacterium]